MKKGWEYKKLGEIAKDMYRGSGIRRDQITAFGYPCIRYGEIYTTYNIAFENCISHTIEDIISPRKYFEHGDLLFAITGESVEDIGKTIAYLGHDKCLLGGDIVCMKHDENPKYLAYALSSREAIKQKGIGKTKLKVVHTNIPSLKEILIPVPPLSEQQSIVDYLDSAFAKIDAMKANAEKALNEAKALFQASLKEMLKPKEGWEEKSLKEITTKISDGSHNPPTGLSFSEYEMLSSKNIRNDFFNFDNPRYLSEEDFEKEDKRTNLEKGDVLLTIVGAGLGECCVYNFEKKIVFQRSVSVIKPSYDKITSRFLMYTLQNNYNSIRNASNGAAQKGIYLKQLAAYTILIPPLSEQQSISTTLDSLKSKVDRLQANYEKITQECDALKQAILRQVFE